MVQQVWVRKGLQTRLEEPKHPGYLKKSEKANLSAFQEPKASVYEPAGGDR